MRGKCWLGPDWNHARDGLIIFEQEWKFIGFNSEKETPNSRNKAEWRKKYIKMIFLINFTLTVFKTVGMCKNLLFIIKCELHFGYGLCQY